MYLGVTFVIWFFQNSSETKILDALLNWKGLEYCVLFSEHTVLTLIGCVTAYVQPAAVCRINIPLNH
jgi:hypothetical protein